MSPPTSQNLPRVLTGLVLLALLVGGCAQLGDGSAGGGGSNLPNRGVSGYDIVSDEEGNSALLNLTGESGATVDSARAVLNENQITLYFASHSDEQASISTVTSSDGLTFGDPRELISGDATRYRGLDAVQAPDGTVLSWHTIDGRLGMTRLDPSGTASDDNILDLPYGGSDFVGLRSPSLTYDDDGRPVLYYEVVRVDENDLEVSEIHLALDNGNGGFDVMGPVLQAGTDCVDSQGESTTCWDWRGVGDPEVRRSESAEGRRLWRMIYRGDSPSRRALGFAFSYDGFVWSRYPFSPLFERQGREERSPTNLRLEDRWLMYFVEYDDDDVLGVGVAVSDFGVPSEDMVAPGELFQ